MFFKKAMNKISFTMRQRYAQTVKKYETCFNFFISGVVYFAIYLQDTKNFRVRI